jgi:hypothetical protein
MAPRRQISHDGAVWWTIKQSCLSHSIILNRALVHGLCFSRGWPFQPLHECDLVIHQRAFFPMNIRTRPSWTVSRIGLFILMFAWNCLYAIPITSCQAEVVSNMFIPVVAHHRLTYYPSSFLLSLSFLYVFPFVVAHHWIEQGPHRHITRTDRDTPTWLDYSSLRGSGDRNSACCLFCLHGVGLYGCAHFPMSTP